MIGVPISVPMHFAGDHWFHAPILLPAFRVVIGSHRLKSYRSPSSCDAGTRQQNAGRPRIAAHPPIT